MSNRNGMPSKFQIYEHWIDRLVNDYGKDFYKGNMLPYEGRDDKKNRYMCFACGGFTKIERAHIIPIQDGGGNECENLHLLCAPCHKISENFIEEDYYKWFVKKSPYRSDSIDKIDYMFENYVEAICENNEHIKYPELYARCIKLYGSKEKYDDVAAIIMYHRIVLNTPFPKLADQLNKVYHLINKK